MSTGHLGIKSLAPKYDPKEHAVYVELLDDVVQQGDMRNIALSGSFGAGKSSVLDGFEQLHELRIVRVSLPPDFFHDPASGTAIPGDSTEAPESRANQVQKEIVKQLVYREKPGKLRRSRFRRLRHSNKRDEWVTAFGGGLAVTSLGLLLGIVQPMVERVVDGTWRPWIAYALAVGVIAAGWQMALTFVRNGVLFQASVRAGTATVSLSKDADSYFDRYLDEIEYFFASTKRDIVIFEDLDRSGSLEILDTLRALNGVLNAQRPAKQPIRFIYALSDSVFEMSRKANTTSPDANAGDRTRGHGDSVVGAARTKFFDAIVPVVPFVSPENARDVFFRELRIPNAEVDPALIRLVAHHVPDMRMIKNIHNEFLVYHHQLVKTSGAVPGIGPDIVLALVVYKHVNMADFEAIRTHDSALDKLFDAWRELVKHNLDKCATELAALREQERDTSKNGDTARRLGERLAVLTEAFEQYAASVVLIVGDLVVDDPGDLALWQAVANGDSLRARVTFPSGIPSRAAVEMTFTREELASLLGVDLDPSRWRDTAATVLRDQILSKQADLDFLRHHTWASLTERPQFTTSSLSPDGSALDPQSFATLTKNLLPGALAAELVAKGYLTHHFAVYSAKYYGDSVGPGALEFIHRCIETGVPDPLHELSASDVVAVLAEQGAATDDAAPIFADTAMLNVYVLDYLLEKRPAAAQVVIERLTSPGAQERAFLDAYLVHGAAPASLLAVLAGTWPGVLRYACVEAPVDPASRLGIVDDLLASVPPTGLRADAEVAAYLRSAAGELTSVRSPLTRETAERVFGIFDAVGAKVEDVEPLNHEAKDAVIRTATFEFTLGNLGALARKFPLSLDAMMGGDPKLYAETVGHLAIYLGFVERDPASARVVDDPDSFGAVLRNADEAGSDAQTIDRLVNLAPQNAHVPVLTTAPIAAWRSLVRSRRTHATAENVAAYIEEVGFDEHLAEMVKKSNGVTWEANTDLRLRESVALEIIHSRQVLPSTALRVRLAKKLSPGQFDLQELEPESGDLIKRLLAAKMVADTEELFGSPLMVDWPTRAGALEVSRAAASFMSPSVVPMSDLPALFHSTSIPLAVRRAVLSDVSEWLTGAPPSAVRRVASALIETRWRLRTLQLSALLAAGATSDQLVALLAAAGDLVTVPELRVLLRSLGGKYAEVADVGRTRPAFPDNPAHQAVLERLRGITIEDFGRKYFRSGGQRLVVRLKARAGD